MFGEEKYYLDLARKLLDRWTWEDLFEIKEVDQVDFLAELIMTQQFDLSYEDLELDDDEEA